MKAATLIAKSAAAVTGDGYSSSPRTTTATTAKITRAPMSDPAMMRRLCRRVRTKDSRSALMGLS